MRESQFKRRFVAGLILCGVLAYLVGRFGEIGFNARWRHLRDGMTQYEVRQALGVPTLIGKTWIIGAGNQPVTRWEYKRGRCSYYVDFDYIGPGGTPVIYRTERIWKKWNWPPWWPWRPLARA